MSKIKEYIDANQVHDLEYSYYLYMKDKKREEEIDDLLATAQRIIQHNNK